MILREEILRRKQLKHFCSTLELASYDILIARSFLSLDLNVVPRPVQFVCEIRRKSPSVHANEEEINQCWEKGSSLLVALRLVSVGGYA